MNNERSNPPWLALVLLRSACRSSYKEALIGDLIEKFREGQTRAWFWRQTLAAVILNAGGQLRSYWPHVSYAATAVLLTWFFFDADILKPLAKWVHWSSLSWPWSQLAFELSRPSLLALAALSTLTVGLIIERSFRWDRVVWTGLISLGVLALGHFSIDVFPWLHRPVPNDLYHRHVLIIPGSIRLALSFCGFFLAALLGCRKSASKRMDLNKMNSRATHLGPDLGTSS